MKWQVARGDNIIYAFEKERLVTMVMDPKISEVPEADRNIRGISFYENRLVIYYQWEMKPTGRIGILLNHDMDTFHGIVVDDILGETENLQEEFEIMIPGMWVMKSD